MAKRSEREVREIAQRMLARVLEMEPGDRTTVARLVHEIEPSFLEDDPGAIAFGGAMFDVNEAFFDLACCEEDLFLDMSEHDGKVEGLPFNLDFVVRRRIEGGGLDADQLLDGLEWAHFEIGGRAYGGSEITFRAVEDGSWVFVDGFVGSLHPDLWRDVSEREVAALKGVLRDSGVLAWEADYWEPTLDGTHWTLHLRFGDGTYFESHGSNGYPDGFDAFVDGLIGLGLKA